MEAPVITVENLSSRFEDRLVLNNISLTIPPGKISVILGKSGCGKTTLLKHILGLYPLQEGEIKIMGASMSTLDEPSQKDLMLRMGVLFQNGALLNSLTVFENVAVPLVQHTSLPEELIEELVCLKLHLVGLDHAMHLYPPQLSGGMRKRAALARAIALDPPLLFCDEPSAGLDPVTMASLDNLIQMLNTQLEMTVVLVTHEVPSIRRLADFVVFLDEGKVLFQGTLTEALSSELPPIREFFYPPSPGE
ncbi:MAG: ATP-binding cassette domain-containing protein [Calditrichaeota bacterium]|nr:MAG: ATP-binding cassette domain-containing protein [Calditrichota bacterium]